MPRTIKRYENRKLYDTEAGRTVSLNSIAKLIRNGEQVEVIDNTSGDDITAQTLTQIIHEQSKKGTTLFSTDLLHNVIRASGKILDERLDKVRHSLDDMLPDTLQRLMPSNRQHEMEELRERIQLLERTLNKLVDDSDDESSADE